MPALKSKITQAVILAGGAGSRLSPYTKSLPKPLMPVGEYPIIEILIRQLARDGIKEIIIAIGEKVRLVQSVLGDGSQFGVKIRYFIEKKPLGTVGSLAQISGLKPNFFVLNGDILSTLSFAHLADSHLKKSATATISVCRRVENLEFGVVESLGDQVISYREKPKFSRWVSMGVYIFSRKIVKFIPRKRFDFPDLVSTLLAAENPPTVYRFRGRWLDIGNESDWREANRVFSRNSAKFLR